MTNTTEGFSSVALSFLSSATLLSLPPGFALRQFWTKRLASWLDWPLSEKMLERICRSVFIGCPFVVGLKASCFAQLLTDPRDLGFAALERLCARVHRVVAKDQRMRMLGRGAEDERRVPVGLQVNHGLGLLEHDELSGLDFFRCAQPAAVYRIWPRLLTAAGLERSPGSKLPERTPHSLRHTFASLHIAKALEAGPDRDAILGSIKEFLSTGR